VAALAAATAAAPAAAQPGRCDSVLAAPAPDSVTHTVAVTPTLVDTAQGVPPSLLALVAQGVAQAFVPPRPLAMWIYEAAPTPAGAAPQGYPVLHGDYVAVLHRDGRLAGAAVLGSSLDAAFDRALLAAVARVDSIGYRFPPPASMAGDSAFVRLRVGPSTGAQGEVPMFRARVPRRTFSEAHTEGPPPPVGYSPEALAAGARGVVTVWFVVDSAGAPVARSVQVLRADHPLLLRMVLDELPTLRYRPTRVAGCAVATHVAEAFDIAPPAGAVAGAASSPAAARPAAAGRARTPARRLDSTRPQLAYDGVGLGPSGARRGQVVISVRVAIDEAGQPDMSTLRVTGLAAASSRGEVERWVAAGRYEPARDAAGSPVRGEFRYELSARLSVRRVP
jgi:hypothetical protein